MPGELRLYARPHPLHDRRVDIEIPAGLTLEQIFALVQPNAVLRRGAAIYIDDWYIPETMWHCVKPRPGRFVQIAAALPRDPGGGGKKSPLRIVLSLAIVAASFAIPTLFPLTAATPILGSLTAGGLITGAISLVGMAALNALMPPQPPKLPEMAGRAIGGGTSPSMTITGLRNAENRYGVIPRVMGTWRWFPPLGAKGYREIIGNETFWRFFCDLGYGPQTLSEHRIGDRPIGELKDVQLETRGTPGQAAVFDGVDDSVGLGSDPKLNVTGALSLLVWFKIAAGAAGPLTIVGWRSAGATTFPFHLEAVESGSNYVLRFSRSVAGVATAIDDTTALARDTWYHGAFVADAAGAWRFKIDGGAGASGTMEAARQSGDDACAIGRADSARFHGTLDDVEIWSRALTDTEIAAKANWRPIKDTTGLVGRWEFDDASAKDVSGNQLDGTIQGGGLSYVEGQTFKDYPVTLFAQSPNQKGYSIRARKEDGDRILDSGPDADEIIVELTALGLVAYNDEAQATERAVDFQIEYQLKGEEAWTTWGTGVVEGTDIAAVAGFSTPIIHTVYSGGNRDVDPVPIGEEIVGYDVTPARLTSLTSNFADKNIRTGDTVTIQGFANPENNGTRTVRGVSTRQLDVSGQFAAEAAGATITVTAQGRSTTIKAATADPYTESVRMVMPKRGDYRIKIKRLTDDSNSDRVRDEFFITAVNTITYRPPVLVPGRTYVAGRVKATGEFNGELDSYNVLSRAMVPVHDGERWLRPQISANQAWYALDFARGEPNKNPCPDSNIDFTSWLDFAVRNDEASQNGKRRHTVNGVVDTRRTARELIAEILATARATIAMPDFKFGVAWEGKQLAPVRMVSPRNSWGWKMTTVFVDRPHALIVQFTNAARNFKEDQVVVYDDGHDEKTAARFETMPVAWLTDRDEAWRMGRYRLADGKLRPRIYENNMDAESMLLERNSLADVAHDVIRVGRGSGQVVSVTKNAEGQAVALTVDELLTLEAGKSYGLKIRRPGGVNIFVNLMFEGATIETRSLVPAAPITAGSTPEPGDHFLFGETGLDSKRLIVSRIRRGPNRSANLSWVDEAPEIDDADRGPIPAYDPGQSFGPVARARPPKPVITSHTSDETAIVKLQDGTLLLRIVVTLSYESGQVAAPGTLEARWRANGSNANWATKSLPADTRVIALDQVEEGVAYEAEFWTTSLDQPGLSSEAARLVHTVVGKITPPPDIPAVLLENGGLKWLYPDQPNDFWGFRVRFKLGVDRNPAGAQSAHPSLAVIASPPFPVNAFPGGTVTVFVWAVDTSGNESLNPAIMIHDAGPPLRDNVLVTVDYRTLGWPGETTGELNAGDLAAAPDPEAFIPAGDDAPFIPAGSSAAFIPADGSGNWGAFEYTAVLDVSQDWLPAQLTLDFEVEGPVAIEYQTDATDVFIPEDDDTPFIPEDDGAPFIPAPPGFMPWPVGVPLRKQPYQFRLSAPGGLTRPRVKQLKAVIDVADVSEVLTDVALTPGGSRLPITKSFRAIVTVGDISIVGAGDAVAVKILDKDADLGPLLAAYDASGTSVATTINATPQGY